MTVIHAFPRKLRRDHNDKVRPHTVEVNGTKYKFTPDDEERYVCTVENKSDAAALLAIKDHYVELGVKPAPQESDEDDDDSDEVRSPYILTQDGNDGQEETLDLRTLDKAALLKFCADNEIKVHPNAGEDTIRDKIVAFFKVV